MWNYKMHMSPDIVTEINIRRLELLERVIGMEDTRIPKMALNTKPEGRHRVRKPKLRWLDNLEADIKTLRIKRWRL
jgi:hypothetical protein